MTVHRHERHIEIAGVERRVIVAITWARPSEPASGLYPGAPAEAEIEIRDADDRHRPDLEALIDAGYWCELTDDAIADADKDTAREWHDARANGACIPARLPRGRLLAG